MTVKMATIFFFFFVTASPQVSSGQSSDRLYWPSAESINSTPSPQVFPSQSQLVLQQQSPSPQGNQSIQKPIARMGQSGTLKQPGTCYDGEINARSRTTSSASETDHDHPIVVFGLDNDEADVENNQSSSDSFKDDGTLTDPSEDRNDRHINIGALSISGSDKSPNQLSVRKEKTPESNFKSKPMTRTSATSNFKDSRRYSEPQFRNREFHRYTPSPDDYSSQDQDTAPGTPTGRRRGSRGRNRTRKTPPNRNSHLHGDNQYQRSYSDSKVKGDRLAPGDQPYERTQSSSSTMYERNNNNNGQYSASSHRKFNYQRSKSNSSEESQSVPKGSNGHHRSRGRARNNWGKRGAKSGGNFRGNCNLNDRGNFHGDRQHYVDHRRYQYEDRGHSYYDERQYYYGDQMQGFPDDRGYHNQGYNSHHRGSPHQCYHDSKPYSPAANQNETFEFKSINQNRESRKVDSQGVRKLALSDVVGGKDSSLSPRDSRAKSKDSISIHGGNKKWVWKNK